MEDFAALAPLPAPEPEILVLPREIEEVALLAHRTGGTSKLAGPLPSITVDESGADEPVEESL